MSAVRRAGAAIRRSLAGESRRKATDAEGATAPETLRQKDREGDEILESKASRRGAFTEGVSRQAGEISQVQ
jgi:hypothetical protein